MENINGSELIKNLQKMFVEKLPYLDDKDLKAMSKTFNDMQYPRAFKEMGVVVEENDDKAKYFTEFSKVLLDSNKFETRFSSAMLLEMVAIERAVINTRLSYLNEL